MALNYPVPEGGTEGNLVQVADDGHSLNDGPFDLAANGASGAVTASQYGDGSAGQRRPVREKGGAPRRCLAGCGR